MDLTQLNIVVSTMSAVLMLIVIIYLLTYVLGSFSSKSGSMSLKFVTSSLVFFSVSSFVLFKGVEWFSELARMRTETGTAFYLNIGASGLALTAIFYAFSGFITVALYLKGQITRGQVLQRASDNIRRWIRARR